MGPLVVDNLDEVVFDLILFSCRRQLKLGGVRVLKLKGDIRYYGH